jgi:hypothetical protein
MTIHSLITLADDEAVRVSPAGIHSGTDITVQNVDVSAYIYLGGQSVTSSNYGYRLAPGAAFSIELPSRDGIYAISDTDNSQVAVLMAGLE